MQIKPIPGSFLRGQVGLTFSDMLWGYEHQMIGWSGVVDLADKWLDTEIEDPRIVELTTIDKSHTFRVGELLRQLAGSMGAETEAIARSKWLRIILAWLFLNKDLMSDPLGEVEMIYADFDYPSEIETFVRYMPCTDGYDPTAHSHDQNVKRLLENWERYLFMSR